LWRNTEASTNLPQWDIHPQMAPISQMRIDLKKSASATFSSATSAQSADSSGF